MPNIIVMGASAGGVEALSEIVRGLPSNLPAAIFTTMHLSPSGKSILPELLTRAGPLKAAVPGDGEDIRPSRIYVAPPDHHMFIETGRVRVIRGPRENRHRPAIDPLFRTAARTYGSRVLGIQLTGMLDDGASGLQIIKSCGGTVIVQDPDDAMFSDMPRNALRVVTPDYVLPLAEIAGQIRTLVKTAWPHGQPRRQIKTNDEGLSQSKDAVTMDDERVDGKPSAFTCPDCAGTLWEANEAGMLRFRCRVGHAFSPESVRAGYDETTEAALWAASRALVESAALERRLADNARARGDHSVAARFDDVADGREEHAAVIRDMLISSGKN